MVRSGYDKYHAAGLVAVVGGLGIVGVTNNISISSLFIAPICPAILEKRLAVYLGNSNFFCTLTKYLL